MKAHKKILAAILCCGIATVTVADHIDVYQIKMSLKVPRIYDNTQSKGYRKYQMQSLKGEMRIVYPSATEENPNPRPKVYIDDLINKTHKISGNCITYKVSVNNIDDEYSSAGPMTRVNVIGDNKKDVFDTASVVFYIDAEPDYNKGADDEDNSLLMTLGAKGSCRVFTHYGYVCQNGKLKKVAIGKCKAIWNLSGSCAGTLGCGCTAYEHVSPTRVAAPCGHTKMVDDVAACFGTWSAAYLYTEEVDCN